jgi:hypothetical protein
MQIGKYTVIKTSELEQLRVDVEVCRKNYNGQLVEANKQRGRRDAYKLQLDSALTELDHWKQHGQLRDPATGRLIPKASVSTEAV